VAVLGREGKWIGIVKVEAIVDPVAAEERRRRVERVGSRKRRKRKYKSRVVAEKVRSNTIMSQ
jgi:hypothetical protein